MLVPYYSRTLSFRQGVGGTNDRYGSAYLYPLCTFCQCKPIYAHLIVGYSYGRVEKKNLGLLSLELWHTRLRSCPIQVW